MKQTYVLVTPARNEEAYIENTIQSVVSQTMLPKKWVIVSDGSTDRTDEIVEKYESKYDFMQLVKAENTESRNFGSKVNAFKAGYDTIGAIQYDFIGNLDADVSFDSSYFENIINEFGKNAELGLAGGVICELINSKYIVQSISLNSVAGAVQLFRRKCYEDIGGYVPLKVGGIDSAAEIMARMKGWNVRTFKEFSVLHHRRVGTVKINFFKSRFQKGIINYSLGYHPLFQVAISIYRCIGKPYIIDGLLMLFGYYWGVIRNYDRAYSEKVIDYLRAEQLERIGLKFISKWYYGRKNE